MKIENKDSDKILITYTAEQSESHMILIDPKKMNKLLISMVIFNI